MPSNTPNGLPYPVGTDRVADGDNAIRALAEAVDPFAGDTGWITVGSGGSAPAYGAGMSDASPATDYRTRFRRVGKMVTVAVAVQRTNTLVIFTLPAGYRPSVPVFVAFGAGAALATMYPPMASILPTGVVGMGSSTAASNAAFYGTITFPTDEAHP